MVGEVVGVAARYAAALDTMQVGPGDRVLEVGCGYGVAISYLCERLRGDGLVHAIDRSASMVEAARRRNAHHLAAGLAVVEAATISEAVLPTSSFDWVVAIRVREVWTEAAATLPRIRDWLRPDGRVCLVIDAPSDARLAGMVDEATAALRSHGFSDLERRLQRADRLAVVTAGLLDEVVDRRGRGTRSTF